MNKSKLYEIFFDAVCFFDTVLLIILVIVSVTALEDYRGRTYLVKYYSADGKILRIDAVKSPKRLSPGVGEIEYDTGKGKKKLYGYWEISE